MNGGRGLVVGRARFLLLVAFCAATAARGAEEGVAPPWFELAGEERGLDFEHRRAATERFWFPEIMSGGAAWLDYDGDGDLDLYLVQGGDLEPTPESPTNRLLRNDEGRFADVTASAGVGDRGYGMGAAVGDYDGDGRPDLYVTNVGANVLYRNRGDGTFERAAAGVEDEGWGTSAAFLDYDRDGDLDLFVVNYVHWSSANEVECYSGGVRDYCHPNRYKAPARDRLYRNDSDGSFSDVSEEAGIAAAFGNGLGVAPLDFDEDGWPDLFVANDGMPNQLWVNRHDGRFEDRALLAGCAVNMAGAAEAGMGVAVGDVDGDGRSDLLLTHLRQETNTLYLIRDGYCEDATARSGLAAPSINRTGFGTVLADFDHDGRLDLLVANGRVGVAGAPLAEGDPFAEPNQLFRGLEFGRFEELPNNSLGGLIENSRAAPVADFDGDGDLDVVVINNGGSARLLVNQTDGAGWARFRVLESSGAEALGGRVDVESAPGRQTRRVQSAYGYCAANDPAAHFGLGEAALLEVVEARWPGGGAGRYRRLPSNRTLVLYNPLS